ncbi:MAG: carboxypeptidase-like regulatory domain-containing protein, partial [Polaribacter sp.]
MKIIIKISCLLFLGSASIKGQTNSISGKVSSNGEVLPFVNVYLKKNKQGTSTNENGFFELKNIPNGTYTIVASSIGFKFKSKKITLTGNQKIVKNFNLKVNDALEEIVISGTLR